MTKFIKGFGGGKGGLTMKKYIDASKIRFSDLSNGLGLVWVTYKEWIDEMPAADVEEVRHGKWKKEYMDSFGGGKRNYKMICPFCDYSYFDNHCGFIVPEHFNYCPNCGAKMDGKEKE